MAAENFDRREVLDLVGDLIRATEAGRAKWQLVDEAEDTFVLETPGGVVAIRSLGGGDHPFLLRLYDGNERKLFELQTEVAPFYQSSEALVGELFRVARNSVFDISGTIRNIRDSLDLR